MAAIDPSQFRAVHKLFPQLTLTQFADAFMCSKGVPTATIAELRGVSENAVNCSLKSVRKNLGGVSAHAMITAIDMSVNLEVLATLEIVGEIREEVLKMKLVLEGVKKSLDEVEKECAFLKKNKPTTTNDFNNHDV